MQPNSPFFLHCLDTTNNTLQVADLQTPKLNCYLHPTCLHLDNRLPIPISNLPLTYNIILSRILLFSFRQQNPNETLIQAFSASETPRISRTETILVFSSLADSRHPFSRSCRCVERPMHYKRFLSSFSSSPETFLLVFLDTYVPEHRITYLPQYLHKRLRRSFIIIRVRL